MQVEREQEVRQAADAGADAVAPEVTIPPGSKVIAEVGQSRPVSPAGDADEPTIRPSANAQVLQPDSSQIARVAAVLRDESVPEKIGPFKIHKLLGRGGMGAVYEAEQSHPRRTVALKVIDSTHVTESALRHFEIEADAMARLEHVGIARMYEAGMAGTAQHPQPFFAMELVRGQTLTKFANERALSVNQKLDLLARLCDAVHYAHQRGVIHRDLKPANILVDDSGQPKILDFGVAYMTESDGQPAVQLAQGHGLVGTILYMSPEQAGGDPRDLDTRSDIYALGVIGFQLLTGRWPHNVKDKSTAEVVRMIRYDEPARLSSIDQSLRGDVDAIIGKALENDRDRRYASAAGLAADIRRHFDHEPVLARTHTAGYRVSTFTRKHMFGVGALTAVMLALLIGLIIATVELQRATKAQQKQALSQAEAMRQTGVAQKALADQQISLINELVDHGGSLVSLGEPAEALRAFKDALAIKDALASEDALARIHAGSGPAWQIDPAILDLWRGSPPTLGLIDGDFKPILCTGLSHNGRRVWVLDAGGLKKFDGPTGQSLSETPFANAAVSAFDDQSATIVAGGPETLATFNAETGTRRDLLTHGAGVLFAAISAGGRFVATASGAAGSDVRIWDVQSNVPPRQLPAVDQLNCLAVSADGKWVITGQATGELQMWDALLGRLVKTLASSKHKEPVTCVCFAGPGRAISGNSEGILFVWDLSTGDLKELAGHHGGIVALSTSRAGDKALSGSTDQTVRLWDLAKNEQVCAFAGHRSSVTAVAFGNDDRLMISGSKDGDVRLCDLELQPVPRVKSFNGPASFATVSPEGLLALLGTQDGHVVVVDKAMARPLETLDAEGVTCGACVPNSGRVILCGPNGTVRAWDLAAGRWAWSAVPAPGDVTCVTVSADGRKILCGCESGDLQFFDADGHPGKCVKADVMAISCVTLSSNLKYALCGTFNTSRRLLLVDLASGSVSSLLQRGPLVTCVALDPAGGSAVSGDQEGVLRVWRPSERRMLQEFSGHKRKVTAAAFSGDGNWLLSGADDGSLKVWGLSLSRGGQVGVLRGDVSGIACAALTSAGWTVISRDGGVWDFSLPARYRELSPRVQAPRELLHDRSEAAAMATVGEWYSGWGPADWGAELLGQADRSGAAVSALVLARSYWRAGRGDDAAKAFDRAAANHEAPESYLKLCAKAATRAPATTRQSPSPTTAQAP